VSRALGDFDFQEETLMKTGWTTEGERIPVKNVNDMNDELTAGAESDSAEYLTRDGMAGITGTDNGSVDGPDTYGNKVLATGHMVASPTCSASFWSAKFNANTTATCDFQSVKTQRTDDFEGCGMITTTASVEFCGAGDNCDCIDKNGIAVPEADIDEDTFDQYLSKNDHYWAATDADGVMKIDVHPHERLRNKIPCNMGATCIPRNMNSIQHVYNLVDVRVYVNHPDAPDINCVDAFDAADCIAVSYPNFKTASKFDLEGEACDGVCVNVASRMVQKEALHHAQCAYFVSIVVVQWADLVICKTRMNSIYHQGMLNPAMNFGLIFETMLAAILCYTPGVTTALGTRPIKFIHWFPGCLYSIFIFWYDEARKYSMRKTTTMTEDEQTGQVTRDPGWMERNTYY